MAWAVGGTPPGMNPLLVKRVKNGKSPVDVTPITIDFRGALAAIDGDTLNTASAPVITSARNDDVASDLTFVPPAQFNSDATRVTIWLAEGTAGMEYLISTTAQSAMGQTLERSFVLPVYYR